MPKTPLNQRLTRSYSNPNSAIAVQSQLSKSSLGGVSIEDLTKTIKDAKEEILLKLTTELAKMNECISALTSKVINIETGLAEMQSTSDRHEKQISDIVLSIDGLRSDLFSSVSEEVEQRCNRMQNLVVSGLTELDDGTVDESKI